MRFAKREQSALIVDHEESVFQKEILQHPANDGEVTDADCLISIVSSCEEWFDRRKLALRHSRRKRSFRFWKPTFDPKCFEAKKKGAHSKGLIRKCLNNRPPYLKANQADERLIQLTPEGSDFADLPFGPVKALIQYFTPIVTTTCLGIAWLGREAYPHIKPYIIKALSLLQ